MELVLEFIFYQNLFYIQFFIVFCNQSAILQHHICAYYKYISYKDIYQINDQNIFHFTAIIMRDVKKIYQIFLICHQNLKDFKVSLHYYYYFFYCFIKKKIYFYYYYFLSIKYFFGNLNLLNHWDLLYNNFEEFNLQLLFNFEEQNLQNLVF